MIACAPGTAVFVTSGGTQRGWPRSLAYAAVAAGVALMLIPDLLRPYPALGPDGHMRASLSRAINLAYCQTPRLSALYDVPKALTVRPAGMFEPIRDVIGRCCGSLANYCASLHVARVDNETSLMWLMRGILAIDPGVSTAGIGMTLASLRLIMLLVLCAAISRTGASLLLLTATAAATSGVLRNLRIYQYHYVPFVLMLPLLLIGVYLFLLQSNVRGRGAVAATFIAAGALTAFCVNMRTSHAPIYLAMFALFFLAWRRPSPPLVARPSRRLQFGGMALFAAGLLCGHELLVTPIEISGAEGVSYHMLMHPVVLGLAEPPNDLSRREGLAWDDAVGDAVARRIDPQARYLSAGYGPALLHYYVGLWKGHPLEMLGVYAMKFQAAGSGVFADAAELLEHRGLPEAAGAWLARRSVPGSVMFLFAATLATAGWWIYRRTGALLGFALALWSTAAIGTILESALVLSRFFIAYHSVLLLYLLLAPVILVQVSADWARSRFARGRAA